MRVERAEENGAFAGGLSILATAEEVKALHIALKVALGKRTVKLTTFSPILATIAKLEAVLKLFEDHP